MPPERQIRVRHARARTPDLPSPFRPVMLRDAGDAFAHACNHAAALGGGTLVYVGRFDFTEFAVVLEPDEALALAWLALYAGMVALVESLATVAPPGKTIAVAWPDAILVNGGPVGGGRLAWPGGVGDAEMPSWLVFGAMIRMVSLTDSRAGFRPLATALESEGFQDIDADRLVESFARHLLRTIDHWRESGFTAIANEYSSRLEQLEGMRYAIGESGELLVTRPGGSLEHRPLRPKLGAPSWLDPDGGEPRG
jgi:biotin-(acetyl-CoA carboxylase) ligase